MNCPECGIDLATMYGPFDTEDLDNILIAEIGTLGCALRQLDAATSKLTGVAGAQLRASFESLEQSLQRHRETVLRAVGLIHNEEER